MDVLTYTGNSTSNRALTGLNFQPDFVWNKARSNGYNHKLYDSVRGVTKQLASNLTDAESTTGTDFLVSFDSNGITIGNDTGFNGSGATFVDWFWKAGGATGVTNTAGSITSTVSANTSAGFSVVTYTGNGTAGATVGHGLGVAPKMIIVKNRTTTTGWPTYHASQSATPANNFLMLNETAATGVLSTIWNNTAPTSTVFSIGTSALVNGAFNFVAYCFSEVAGYSKFGSYTGNGSADGTFVHLGFRPAFVMVKRINSTNNWIMWDTSRSNDNIVDDWLYANLSDAEAVASGCDFLSNGFKLRNSANAINGSEPYIYMAFAENPFKYSLAR
jgi:hypothetical protein